MKKLTSMYKKYMLRPILYKLVTRAMAAAVLSLLWDRYISEGYYSLWEGPALVCGAAFLLWAWVCYLRLDGVTVHGLVTDHFKERQQEQKPRATRSIVDFADEKIVAFEELEPDERTYCSMLASLVLGLPLVAVGVAASIL